MRSLRLTPIHRALYRPQLYGGGERELVLATGLLTGGLAMTALNLVAFITSAVVYVVCISGLRMMAKADPQMSKVYRRYIKYRRYYPARSRPVRVDPNWK